MKIANLSHGWMKKPLASSWERAPRTLLIEKLCITGTNLISFVLLVDRKSKVKKTKEASKNESEF